MPRADWNRPALTKIDPDKRRIMIVVSYHGGSYHGFQSQSDIISVQNRLNEVLTKLTGETIVVQGSGRTDKGVHALEQYCHFDVSKTCSIPPEKYSQAMATKLEKSIKVLLSKEVDDTFHARFTTMAREYKYFIKAEKDFLPFDEGRITSVKKLPPLELLNEYASVLEGTHDFTTFASSRDGSVSKWRDIYTSNWTQVTDIYSKTVYVYTVVGNAFLYHQVRSMVGTMIHDGMNNSTKEVFLKRLEDKNRFSSLTTADGKGLYLSRISYDEDEYAWFEEKSNE